MFNVSGVHIYIHWANMVQKNTSGCTSHQTSIIPQMFLNQTPPSQTKTRMKIRHMLLENISRSTLFLEVSKLPVPQTVGIFPALKSLLQKLHMRTHVSMSMSSTPALSSNIPFLRKWALWFWIGWSNCRFGKSFNHNSFDLSFMLTDPQE